MTGSSALTIHIMTSALSPGDAIGNYILTSARLWRSWGARVEIYADSIAPDYGAIANPSEWYRASGRALLWYHYSIFTDNLQIAIDSNDYKVMDFHGIAPPHLFAGQNSYLQELCRRGLEALPALRDHFDYYVVHSEYTRGELLANGYARSAIHKLPLCVDTKRFEGAGDDQLSSLLSKLEYFLFVGRVVPQKDILALLEIFARIHEARPDAALILVGSRHLASNYQRQLDRAIKQRGLASRVIFTGQVNNPDILATLFRQARLLFVTSDWESFCVPLVEAMYFGTPVVTHSLQPLPEVAGSGGIVIDKHRPSQAADQVLVLLEDEKRYTQLSQTARVQAASFTDEALAKALLEMLQKLSEDPAPRGA